MLQSSVCALQRKPDTLKAALLPGKRKLASCHAQTVNLLRLCRDLQHLLNFREITQWGHEGFHETLCVSVRSEPGPPCWTASTMSCRDAPRACWDWCQGRRRRAEGRTDRPTEDCWSPSRWVLTFLPVVFFFFSCCEMIVWWDASEPIQLTYLNQGK